MGCDESIETLFDALKYRGFNFEAIQLTHPEQIGKLWALRGLIGTGHTLAEYTLIPIKITIQHPLKSIFRYSFDFIHHTVLNLEDWRAEFFSMPPQNAMLL